MIELVKMALEIMYNNKRKEYIFSTMDGKMKFQIRETYKDAYFLQH